MPRLLVVRRGGLGDTLLMLPVLRALRRGRRDAALHFAGVREFAAVLAAHGACDEAISSEALALWSATAARERLAGYDLVFADDPVAVRAAAAGRLFDPRPRDASPIGLQIARQLDLECRWPEDAWFATAPGGRADGPFVLAPGSGGAAKCWPRDGWLALAAALGDAPVEVVVGPAELERDDPRRWPWPRGAAPIVEADVTALAARLAAARAFVGNDSGPTHLAAMLGVPTVALFGPSDARVFAPCGPRVAVLEAGAGLAALPWQRVADGLAAVLARDQGSRARTRCQ